MLPVPTIEDLSDFTGRPSDSYGPFAESALRQATLLFSLLTRLTAYPTDPDQAQLATMAILQMADRIYLEQPNAQIKAGPFQSETIGSYSYSKAAQLAISASAEGSKTGLIWWDLALQNLTLPGMSNVTSHYIADVNGDIYVDAGNDARFLVTPAQLVSSQYHNPDMSI